MEEHVVVAQVILKAKAATAGEAVTAENVKEFSASPQTVEAASKELEKLGFRVASRGPASLSIEGSREALERAFSSTIADSGEEWTEPISIPASLESTVSDVVLPQAPELFP
jgi:subtilase family serine protease